MVCCLYACTFISLTDTALRVHSADTLRAGIPFQRVFVSSKEQYPYWYEMKTLMSKTDGDIYNGQALLSNFIKLKKNVCFADLCPLCLHLYCNQPPGGRFGFWVHHYFCCVFWVSFIQTSQNLILHFCASSPRHSENNWKLKVDQMTVYRGKTNKWKWRYY